MRITSAIAAVLLSVAGLGGAQAATSMSAGDTPGTWQYQSTGDQSFSFSLGAGNFTASAYGLGFSFLDPSFSIDSITISDTENGPGQAFTKVSNNNWSFMGSLAGGTHFVNVDVTGVGFYGGGVQTVSAVPEPGSYALFFAGLGVVGFIAKRRRPER